MTWFLPYVITYAVLTIWIVGFVISFRKYLSCMAGMMAAMALGMTIGLGIGMIIAFWLPGQFFHASMISMMIGGLVGAVAGVPISLMAILDGLLSGMMGGMMGAMLAVMIPDAFIESTVKIMTVLCFGILFLLLIMLQGEVKHEYLMQKSFLLSKPLSMFLVICFAFFILHQTTTINVGQGHENTQMTEHPRSP